MDVLLVSCFGGCAPRRSLCPRQTRSRGGDPPYQFLAPTDARSVGARKVAEKLITNNCVLCVLCVYPLLDP